jgi:hypothetical protein
MAKLAEGSERARFFSLTFFYGKESKQRSRPKSQPAGLELSLVTLASPSSKMNRFYIPN